MFPGFIMGIILGWGISKLAPWFYNAFDLLARSKFSGNILSLLLSDSFGGILILFIPFIGIAFIASYILRNKIENNFLKGLLIAYYATIFPGAFFHLAGPNASESDQQAVGMIMIFIYPLYLTTITPILLLIHLMFLKKWQKSQTA